MQTMLTDISHAFLAFLERALDRLMNDPAVGFIIFIIFALLYLQSLCLDNKNFLSLCKHNNTVLGDSPKPQRVVEENKTDQWSLQKQKERLLRQLNQESLKWRRQMRKKRQSSYHRAARQMKAYLRSNTKLTHRQEADEQLDKQDQREEQTKGWHFQTYEEPAKQDPIIEETQEHYVYEKMEEQVNNAEPEISNQFKQLPHSQSLFSTNHMMIKPITQTDNKLFKSVNPNVQQNINQQSANIRNSFSKFVEITKMQPAPSIAHAQHQITITNNTHKAQKISAPQLKSKLNTQQLLQSYIDFADSCKEVVHIPTKVESLIGGARSSPNFILIQAKSLFATIDKNDDKQITAFALKLYQTIVYNFINNSNVKSGLQRIPLRERTKQCQKNAINAYILTINMYRLMPQGKKIWTIVFGKILKMLSFLYKRKQDLQDYQRLELIECNYIKKFKEVHSKYVSRIDFLIYFLLGLTAFDPLLIIRQVQTKDKDVKTCRTEIESWGNKWSYSEFWSLVHAVLNNKHESYSKPIFWINLLYVLYPRILEHKLNSTLFKHEYELYLIVINRAKTYLKGYTKMKEVKILSQNFENEQYEYDGPDFVKSIQVLDSRFAEKEIEIKMNAKEFQAKANVFYYFTKEK